MYTLVDEIPSDNESIVSDDSSDIEDTEAIDKPAIDVLDEEMESNHSDWDSEDELPLATYVPTTGETNVQWTKTSNKAVIREPFTETCGPNVPDNIQTPVDLLLYLFSEELIEKIVWETNLYATQKHIPNMYKPTTIEEIKCFMGINILMGIKKLPSYKDYWSSRADLRDDFISSCMSRNRFSWLLGHIHLNDNSKEPAKGQPNYDKLYKLRPMLEKLSETYAKSYKPTHRQAVDESMIKFKSRVSFRQYMPMKPVKRGYKVWMRANETGFISQFEIYTGKNDYHLMHGNNTMYIFLGKAAGTNDTGLGERVVTNLTKDLAEKNHEVYFDNFFNSVSLQTYLQKIAYMAVVQSERLERIFRRIS